jgi:hypothetical protein
VLCLLLIFLFARHLNLGKVIWLILSLCNLLQSEFELAEVIEVKSRCGEVYVTYEGVEQLNQNMGKSTETHRNTLPKIQISL